MQHLSSQRIAPTGPGEPQTAWNGQENPHSSHFTPSSPLRGGDDGDDDDDGAVGSEKKGNLGSLAGMDELEHQFGRLIVDKSNGESRYVSNETLAELGDQVSSIFSSRLL